MRDSFLPGRLRDSTGIDDRKHCDDRKIVRWRNQQCEAVG
jgi:hypothetical protein